MTTNRAAPGAALPACGIAVGVLLLATVLSTAANAYPLDAYPETGIKRVEAFRSLGRILPPGSMLPSSRIRLRLENRPDFEIPKPDPELSEKLREILGKDARYYGVVLLDITDPARPVYAEINPDRSQNIGSVGKIMVDLAFFDELARRHPKVADRRRFLKETEIQATRFIERDSHEVPMWEPGDETVVRRPIELSDVGNLYTWLDWMNSSSSNAAASVMISQLMLMKHFAKKYPVSREVAADYFAKTPKPKLSKLLEETLISPIRRNGLNPGKLRQGAFFTRYGKNTVPGGKSWGSSRAMLDYMVLMEQGKLVDPFSSLEIKKMLYNTDHRIRYTASPALLDSAVYYKSGSLYSCKPEKGYECKKYEGNKWNYLSSMTIVESADRQPELDYMVVVTSNVLKKNSADEHERLATAIHELMEERHPRTLVRSETESDDRLWSRDPFSGGLTTPAARGASARP